MREPTVGARKWITPEGYGGHFIHLGRAWQERRQGLVDGLTAEPAVVLLAENLSPYLVASVAVSAAGVGCHA